MRNSRIKFKKYKEELKAINAELEQLPPGRLVQKGKYFFQVIDQKEIGITKKSELIKQYYRKRYVLTRKDQLERNMPNTSRYLKSHQDTLPTELIDSFSSSYQQLPLSSYYHPTVEKWLEEPVEENKLYPENRKFPTRNNIKVRSKSEQTIGNLLEEYGLLYRYDVAFKLGTQTKFPDFIIMNPFNGKVFIWEHFGALNQPEYMAKMNEKMSMYSAYDYHPFENIIYTFEFDIEHPQRLRDIVENIIFAV